MVVEDGIERINYHDSPWWQFMEKTKGLDSYNHKPFGWHWFWAVSYLYTDPSERLYPEIEAIQNKLPDGHWLKKVDSEPKSLKKIIDENNRDANLFATAKKFAEDHKLTDIIDFSKLCFNHPAIFFDFVFPIPVSFEQTKFLGNAHFADTIFLEGARFTEAKFLQDADFTNTIFLEDADFSKTKLSKNTYFTSATFSKTASFIDAVFDGETANFSDANFIKIADFNRVIFNGYANFKGATLGGRTIFQGATFKYHAPRFYDANVNNEIILNSIVLPKHKRRYYINDKLEKKIEDDKSYQKRIEENQSAYETLVFLMETLHKYHNQHYFFREEMNWRQVEYKLKRQRLKERFDWKFVWPRIENNLTIAFFFLYRILANYGHGIGRAFTWWFGNIAVWAGVLMFFNYQKDSMVESPFWCSVLTSAINAHSFLLSKGAKMANCYGMAKHKLALDLIWAGEAILGAMFLFLILLTLRVRFRLK